ncbi:hypothetical protein WMY93_001984 [Mugilogobius chulae]|uniref:Uncharacterized protein n=1 Tax=Mugilogobius chulae TaxID=88201 RepID=A0AAW0PS93_9GOBI
MSLIGHFCCEGVCSLQTQVFKFSLWKLELAQGGSLLPGSRSPYGGHFKHNPPGRPSLLSGRTSFPNRSPEKVYPTPSKTPGPHSELSAGRADREQFVFPHKGQHSKDKAG